MKQGKEDFEFVKEDDKKKRNYIFKKDTLTRRGFVFIITILALLILGVIFIPRIMHS